MSRVVPGVMSGSEPSGNDLMIETLARPSTVTGAGGLLVGGDDGASAVATFG